MTMRTDREGPVARFSPRGAVTGGGASGFLRNQVALAIADGARNIVIDLSGVRFLDAAGLGELVACRSLARNSGVRLRLTGAIGKALELLRMTGLDRLLSGARSGHPITPLGTKVA